MCVLLGEEGGGGEGNDKGNNVGCEKGKEKKKKKNEIESKKLKRRNKQNDLEDQMDTREIDKAGSVFLSREDLGKEVRRIGCEKGKSGYGRWKNVAGVWG